MAYDAICLYRQNLPGGGFNSTGVASQGKVFAVYQINHTSYLAADVFPPSTFGLETIDFINISPVVANAAYVDDVNSNHYAAYGWDSGLILYWIDEGTLATDAQVVQTRVLVFGTSSTTPELL